MSSQNSYSGSELQFVAVEAVEAANPLLAGELAQTDGRYLVVIIMIVIFSWSPASRVPL